MSGDAAAIGLLAGLDPEIATSLLEQAQRRILQADEVIFTVHADRAGIPDADRATERETFFSRGQACLRTSPLAKRFGCGIHHDAQGRVALVPAGLDEYRRLAEDPEVRKVNAMRSKRG